MSGLEKLSLCAFVFSAHRSFRGARQIAASFCLLTLMFAAERSSAAEVGLGFGPFLPSRISGVGEVMNGAAARLGMATSKGVCELEYFNAHGDGSDYNTFGFDFRWDFANSEMPDFPVFVILGLNLDYYKPSTAEELRQAGGWHYGGGFKIPLGGISSPVHLRAEFKQRFGPGQTLIVLIGLGLFFGNSTATNTAGIP